MQANQSPFSAAQIAQLNDRVTGGPSAFTAAEIRLDELIDLHEFPLHDLTSPRRTELVYHCRAQLADCGCSHIENFVLPEAVQAMREEALRLMPFAIRKRQE